MIEPAPLPAAEPPASGPGPGDAGHSSPHGPALGTLVLGAIGVVFGDIGTSPLYTFQECVGERGVRAAVPDNVLGVCSLIFWSLTMVVTVKYLAFLMRADNEGEGGIFALLALVPQRLRQSGPTLGWITLLVMAGAALLFGDGIITPAISVLSALEGLEVATPAFHQAVVPLTCAILVGLFLLQKRGTGGIGRLFGPVMVVWFAVIAVLGARQIAHHPAVLAGLSPVYAVRFFAVNGFKGFALLGSVVLAVTGGEALYADMGHFGRRPIRMAWLGLIFPALILCYFGQGALLLSDPSHWERPFFDLVPHGWATYALVAIAAPATVIASQALISGVFSLAHQGIQLGIFPRLDIRHTSQEAEGQIYVPALNWGLAVACVLLVLLFKTSAALAAAFGLAVSGTMAITSVIYFEVTRCTWKWPLWKSASVLLLFLSFDLPFFGANLLKFKEGGYLPILVGSGFFVTMVVWRRGRELLGRHNAAESPPVGEFLASLKKGSGGLVRVRGTAIFLTPCIDTVPPVLVRHGKRIHALQERVILLTVVTLHSPTVDEADRVRVAPLEEGFVRVVEHFGFMEHPDIPRALAQGLASAGIPVNLAEATYYLGRETLLATDQGEMRRGEESLFAFLLRNSHSAASYYRVPPEQVIELGIQVDL